MAINFNSALGIHEKALELRSRRAEVLANNIANADTPGYKAKDLEFGTILNTKKNSPGFLRTTNNRHMRSDYNDNGFPELEFRNPTQPSVDGNTVDIHQEKAEYLKNALEFQTSFRFLNGRLKGLKSAIRGD